MKNFTIIEADLHRYKDEVSSSSLLRAFWIPGFRYSYFLRKSAFFNKRSIPGIFFRLMLLIHSYSYGYQINPSTKIGKGLYIGHRGTIIINSKAIIGECCNLSPGVTIGQTNRGTRKGAPVIGNTEILTEYSDILSFAGQYTYKGEAAGYTAQTGATPSSPISQSIQSRLDSYAVITDFGAVGDGVTDDTAAINRALFQLFCVQNNTSIRRSLFFPAGNYTVTDTIKIPPYAKLYGEGASSSIINFSVQNWAANTAYVESTLVYYVPTSTYYRSIAPVPATGVAISNALYWAAESLPSYVLQTADSLQQTGVNIGTNGATPPTSITIENMCFQSVDPMDIAFVNRASECIFNQVQFIGPLTTADLTVDPTSGA